jgi:hypothetical protein
VPGGGEPFPLEGGPAALDPKLVQIKQNATTKSDAQRNDM